MKTTRMVLLFCFMLFAPVGPWVHGQTVPPARNPDLSRSVAKPESPREGQWQFRLIPYMWATTIDSKVTVGGYDAETTTTFSDIWRNLAGAGMLHFEAQKGKVGFFLDPLYMKLRADGTFERRRDPNVPAIPRDLTLTYEQWLVEFGGFYQIGKWSVGQNKGQWMTVDILGGGRYWWVRADLDTSTVINPTETNQWIDPIIGARLTADLTKKVIFNIRADVGGFGVGSDFSWNGIATLGYRFSDRITGLLGYRVLYIDYKSGSGRARYEETIHGPLAGLAFAF